MAKTIKFNLICNDNPIRTIEDLQNNFSVEDILAYYNNKLLHRWLKVREYTDELEKVSAISCEESLEIIKELIQIFNVIADDKKIEESVYILEYLEKRKELCRIYNEENYKAKSIIDDYESGYGQLVRGILDNPDNAARIKANIAEIAENYKWVLDLDYRNLFWRLKSKSTLALLCLLMNKQMRKYYIPDKDNDEKMIKNVAAIYIQDKTDMFKAICALIKESDLQEKLGENLISFAGVTDGYWKDLEPKGKDYMIISMGSGDYVRPAGKSGGDLSTDDITNKFVIVDGIDYKSNTAAHQLLYMEV